MAEHQPERRNLDGLVLRLHDSYTELMTILLRVEGRIHELAGQHTAIASKLEEHIKKEEYDVVVIKDAVESGLERVEDKIEAVEEHLLTAFPDKDLTGHNSFHQEVMANKREIKRRKSEIVTHTAKHAAWAVIVLIATAVYFYIKAQINNE